MLLSGEQIGELELLLIAGNEVILEAQMSVHRNMDKLSHNVPIVPSDTTEYAKEMVKTSNPWELWRIVPYLQHLAFHEICHYQLWAVSELEKHKVPMLSN